MKLRNLLATLLCVMMLLSSVAPALAEDNVYPIPGDVTLTYFGQLHKKVAKSYSSWTDLDVVKDWFAATGVTLDFRCPPSGMEDEQFNMMLASGDYTDIIVYDMIKKVQGGLTSLYEDGVIVDLTDYLEEYAPNYTRYLNEHPDIKQEVMDDNGRIYCFVFAKGGGYLLSTQGPILREDILTALNLEVPTTIDEWETVLRAVKAAYPDMVPFTGNLARLEKTFGPAYGLGMCEWVANDENYAFYAPAEADFRAFLEKMSAWYAEGLIDVDFTSLDDASADNKMSSGRAFASFGAGSSQVATYMNANPDDPTFSTVGVQLPTLEKGDLAKYSTEWAGTANPQCAISTQCKNLEAAIRMYDWGYSEEGSTRLNWGLEGVSYTVDENGEKHYTDLILNNPDGKDVDTALANYALVAVKGPAMLVQDPGFMMDYYALDQQKRSMQNWTNKDMDSRIFPSVSYVDDEAERFTNLMADITTYAESMTAKFIIGSESLDNFDGYLKTINNMGYEEVRTIQQDALDRFNNRGK